MNKPPATAGQPSRQQIFSWIHSLLSDVPLSLKVEELGKGNIYCRLLNHYFPGVILINRIIWSPKSEYENLINLRILQNAFLQLKISIPFDPVRLSKEKLNDNWPFLLAFYRYLTHNCDEQYSTPMPEQPKMSNFYHTYTPQILTPKRPAEHPYPQFFQGLMRQPFYPIENVYQQQKAIYNASKYSVGKLYKEPALQQQGASSPNKGKWSVNSHMFQNNLVPIIDRVKEILLKSSHDTEKIRQVKMLLNIPLNEDVVVKVEEDENNQIIKINPDTTKKEVPTSTESITCGDSGKKRTEQQ